jgi:hypothetical protein
MMPAMSSVTRTITEGMQRGTTWPQMTRAAPAPWSRIAAMWSALRIVSVFGARQARIGRPGRDRDGDDRVLDARARARPRRPAQDQARKGQHDVGGAHQHRRRSSPPK